MKDKRPTATIELLEQRWLLAWSAYAQLVNQDDATVEFAAFKGQGVTIALLDTGVDYTHPNLGGGFGPGYKVVAGYDFVDNDSDPMDQDGHGTSVAGVIAADPYTVDGVTYQGVAPDAKLVALRIGTENSILTANIEKGLKWIINNYQTYGISVVNLSLGSGSYVDSVTNATVSDEFQTLRDLGIFVVAASGNSNDQQMLPIEQDGISYPAADPNVFAVGAVDANDVIASWSQRGDELDLLAPGVGIVAPRKGGGFISGDGTSFASPFVAATAALLKQADPSLHAGDIGSILVSSGTVNRDGDNETGNTTGLLFSRLDITAALSLVSARAGVSTQLPGTMVFDTALDSQGVLHAAYYDPVNGDLLYATRSTSGLWSAAQIIDSEGVVGAQLSIAVDSTGKVGIGYYDSTNTAVKYASFNGRSWSTITVEHKKAIGQHPSLAFDIDGNAYLAYYRKTSGDLRLARLNRDRGTWTYQTVDGTDGANVGTAISLDVGEAAIRTGAFTRYDTTVAIAYADKTNGDLKYARLDVDDPSATWYIAVVDNAQGVANIDLNLHAGPSGAGLQAQIAYQDARNADVKYAYRNTNWYVETVASDGSVGAAVQLWFDAANRPIVTFFSSTKRAIYSSTRIGSGTWSTRWNVSSWSPMNVGYNERSGRAILSYLNRARSAILTRNLA